MRARRNHRRGDGSHLLRSCWARQALPSALRSWRCGLAAVRRRAAPSSLPRALRFDVPPDSRLLEPPTISSDGKRIVYTVNGQDSIDELAPPIDRSGRVHSDSRDRRRTLSSLFTGWAVARIPRAWRAEDEVARRRHTDHHLGESLCRQVSGVAFRGARTPRLRSLRLRTRV